MAAEYLKDAPPVTMRSEEHTSELQSHSDLVCRLLLEKKKQLTSFTNVFKQDPMQLDLLPHRTAMLTCDCAISSKAAGSLCLQTHCEARMMSTHVCYPL